jgi:hypothetical protein
MKHLLLFTAVVAGRGRWLRRISRQRAVGMRNRSPLQAIPAAIDTHRQEIRIPRSPGGVSGGWVGPRGLDLRLTPFQKGGC